MLREDGAVGLTQARGCKLAGRAPDCSIQQEEERDGKPGEGRVRREGDSYGGDFDEVCGHCVRSSPSSYETACKKSAFAT